VPIEQSEIGGWGGGCGMCNPIRLARSRSPPFPQAGRDKEAEMIRPFFTELLLFLAPFVLYVVFLWATKNEILHPDHWPVSRIISLAVAALLLMLCSFLYFANYTGSPVGSNYEPAHMEDGKFVPGRTR
jgi:hypothetical protein